MSLLLVEIVNNARLAEVLLPVIAVLTALIVAVKSTRLLRLQRYFRRSMILVPLYKRRTLTVLLSAVFFVLAIGSVATGLLTGQILIFVSLAVIAFSAFCMLTVMGSVRFAVVDAGVLVPYRFIAWHELYDYYLDGNQIIFSGDTHGRRTLTSTTVKMRFNAQDGHKLNIVLLQNRVKHTRD